MLFEIFDLGMALLVMRSCGGVESSISTFGYIRKSTTYRLIIPLLLHSSI